MRFMYFLIYRVFYSCSEIFNDMTEIIDISIQSIRTMGHIRLVENYEDKKQTDYFEKCINESLLCLYFRCQKHQADTIERIRNDFAKVKSAVYFKIKCMSDLNNVIQQTLDEIKLDIDFIFLQKTSHISTSMKIYWLNWNISYLIKTRLNYQRIIRENIREKKILNVDDIVGKLVEITDDFILGYLKRAIYFLCSALPDHNLIFQVLLYFMPEKFIDRKKYQNNNFISSDSENSVYRLLKKILYHSLETITVTCNLNDENNVKFAKSILKVFLHDLINDLTPEEFENSSNITFKNDKIFKDSSIGFKGEGKIKNLSIFFDEYVQNLKLKNNIDKFINLVFIEIDLNQEINEAFSMLNRDYLNEFSKALCDFTALYLKYAKENNIKVVFVWRKIELTSRYETVGNINKEEWIDIVRKRFLKRILDIWYSYKKYLENAYVYSEIDDEIIGMDNGRDVLKYVFNISLEN